MNVSSLLSRLSLPALAWLCLVRPATAIIHQGATSGDQTFNTVATGTIAEPVFGQVGFLSYPVSNRSTFHFTAVPIGPNYIITASHIKGEAGDLFTLNGVVHTIEEAHVIGIVSQTAGPGDLAICRVSGTFDSWVPLYDKDNELGKPMVFVGAGMIKGPEVVLNGKPIGWSQTNTDLDTKRWGTNTVSSIEPYAPVPGTATTLLGLNFDGNEGPSEAQLSFGDSGGLGFIVDEGVWKVAGTGFGVSGYYSHSADGSNSFAGAMPDTRGLYIESGQVDINGNSIFEYIDPAIYLKPVPSVSYLARVSPHVATIQALMVPEPGALSFLLLSLPLVAARFRRPMPRH